MAQSSRTSLRLIFLVLLGAAGACITPAPKSAATAQPTPTPAPTAPAPIASAFRQDDAGCASGVAQDFDPGLVRVEGRAETAVAKVRFAWPGTALRIRFSGPSLHVDLEDSGRNRYHVYLDGQLLPGKLVPVPDRHCYELVRELPSGAHEVTLYRLTEALLGESVVFGFVTAKGQALLDAPAPRARRIEIIGDSISAAYGVEGTSRDCPFSPDTENHALGYGAILARKFDAELSTIAWSGKGVFSNRGSSSDTVPMPVLWERSLPERADSRWDFARFQPDVVIINLGTNDFAPENPDKAPFATAYLALLRRVREVYPRATVFCAVGPMLNDHWPPDTRARSTVLGHVKAAIEELSRAGDDKLWIVEHQPQSEAEGWGCDWHPNRRTQERMAAELAPAIAARLGWQDGSQPRP